MKRASIIRVSALIVIAILVLSLFCLDRDIKLRVAKPESPRPLFANRMQGDPETGRTGWWIDRVILENGSGVEYDDQENILVVGKRNSPDELLLMPGRKGDYMAAGYKGHNITLPLWKNSAILFDQTGLLRVIFLEKTKARDLFDAINKDNAEIDKFFGPSSPPSR